jgi:2-C-methyl-D-erythritol 4-phosphate cytidylyltransferase
LKNSAIIVAGGTGTRMNQPIPKQFLPLAGKPMVMHGMQAFSDAFPGINLVLALPGDQFDCWNELCKESGFNIPHQLVAGGKTRFHSVQNALQAVTTKGLVAIHDGARPLISADLIKRVFMTAELFGNCIPVIPVIESVRKINGETSFPVDRNTLCLVQTPQVFRFETLIKAYCQEFREEFTDDASVVENTGETVHLTQGEPSNIKITHLHDLALAQWLIKNRQV